MYTHPLEKGDTLSDKVKAAGTHRKHLVCSKCLRYQVPQKGMLCLSCESPKALEEIIN